MDYYSIHGNDIASFDLSNTHRLPTVSASQVLEELEEEGSDCISTGIKALDETLVALPAPSQIFGREKSQSGGIRRGQVTEIWGPPGSGKTALATQLAANALSKDGGAVWIDCFQKTPDERLSAALEKMQLSKETHATDPASAEQASNGDNFTRYSCFTLPHFLALLSRPSSTTIPVGTSLIVVNCVSALINSALPRSHVSKQKTKQPPGTTPSEKRMQALQTIMSLLNKLAATRNCAVVILSQCATKMQSEHGAALVPAVNATVWEQGISTRIALFRNWSWEGRKPHSVFLAGVQQVDGRVMMDVVDNASAFTVESVGAIMHAHFRCPCACVDLANNCTNFWRRWACEVSSTRRAIRWKWRLRRSRSAKSDRRSSRCLIARMRTMAGQTKMRLLSRHRLHSGRAVRISFWDRTSGEVRTKRRQRRNTIATMKPKEQRTTRVQRVVPIMKSMQARCKPHSHREHPNPGPCTAGLCYIQR